MWQKIKCWLGFHEWRLDCDLWGKEFRCKLIGYRECQNWCSEYKEKCRHCGKVKR